jgi:hypothetical protein
MLLQNRHPLVFGVFLSLICGCGEKTSRPPDYSPLTPAEKFADTDILPHAQGAITSGRNYVYCATFQIVWEEIQNTVSGNPIKLAGDPELALILNQTPFDQSNLSEGSYLAMAGTTDQKIVETIRKVIYKKFPDATFNIPDPPGGNAFYAYAYLSKSTRFKNAFDRLKTPLKFASSKTAAEVKAFGVERFEESPSRENALCQQVSILDYQSDDDFILSLNTISKIDHIVLAKIQPEATLQATIEAVENRIKNSKLGDDERNPQQGECLKVPVVAFAAERDYSELTGKSLLNQGMEPLYIAEARQGVRFKLDEFGAKLESGSSVQTDSAKPFKPRHFVFDKPFLIYLKERSDTAPYLAIWIETPELLQKAK